MADPAGGASNVLLVVLDTVRTDHCSVYGYGRPTTPTLDAFANEARVYEHAVAQAPWTLPVHASLFTGLYPSQHGATQEDPYLETDETVAASVSATGYETACFSSNAWITPSTNLTAGFDRRENFLPLVPSRFLSGSLAGAWKRLVDSERFRSVADGLVQLGTKALDRLAASDRGQSETPDVIDATIEFVDGASDFFAFVNLMDAHMPYHPPREYAEAFAPGVDSTVVCQNATDFNVGAREVDAAEWREIRGLYDAELRYADAQLGRLFAHLEATDRWEDTTVIVCADHGELHGEHGLYGHEFAVYDPLVNVPLLVKHPALEPGRDAETTVELLDLYHTILDATGAEGSGVPFDPRRSLLRPDYRDFDEQVASLDRRDLAFVEYHRPVVELRQLESRAAAAGIDLPTESRFYSRMGAVRRPDAKVIHNTHVADEGYRLDVDPGERENVFGRDASVDALATALDSFATDVDAEWSAGLEPVGETGGVPSGMGVGVRTRLRELGYLE